MTELLRNWILGITAVSLLSSFAAALTEGAPGRQAVRLISALALVLAVLLPLRGFRPGELKDRFSAYERELDRETAYIGARTDALLRETTEEALCVWAEARASARGIPCGVRIGTAVRDGAAYPVSCTLTVSPETDAEDVAALGREIAAALGIDAVTVRREETETG